MATRNIVPRATGEGGIGTAAKHWGAGHFDTLPNWQEYLAESTGYGIVSGCTPTISGLTVTVGAGIVHLADGTRKEIASTNITLDAADSTNPRIDLVYIDSTGAVAKVTGTAAATPSVPALPNNGISVAQVSIAAGATIGTVMDSRGMLARYYNTGIISVKDFGAVGDGVHNDTAAFRNALLAAQGKTLVVSTGSYLINDNLFADGVNEVIDNGTYINLKPAYPNSNPLCAGLEYISQYPNPKFTGKSFAVGNCDRLQSITYDSKRDKFILGLINTDTEQVLAVVNPLNLEIETSYNFTELGHINGLMYIEDKDKLYVNGALKNGQVDYSIAMEVDADTYQITRTISLEKTCIAMAYDTEIKCVIGVAGSTSGLNIYTFDTDFNLLHKSGTLENAPAPYGNNGVAAKNGRVMVLCFFTGFNNQLTHVIYDTDIYGNGLQRIPFSFSIEPEGACFYNDKVIFNAGIKQAGVYINVFYQITQYKPEYSLIEKSIYSVPQLIGSKDLNTMVQPGTVLVSRNENDESLNFPPMGSERLTAEYGFLKTLKAGDSEGTTNYTRQLFLGENGNADYGFEIWQRVIRDNLITEWKRVDCYGALPAEGNVAVEVTGLNPNTTNTFTPDRNGYLMISFTPNKDVDYAVEWKYIRTGASYKANNNQRYPASTIPVRKGVPVLIIWYTGTLNSCIFTPMN
jgi:hypothetical protein